MLLGDLLQCRIKKKHTEMKRVLIFLLLSSSPVIVKSTIFLYFHEPILGWFNGLHVQEQYLIYITMVLVSLVSSFFFLRKLSEIYRARKKPPI